MDFKVDLTPEAEADLDEIVLYIASESGHERAIRWQERLLRETRTLRSIPSRCPIIPEAEDIGRPLRALIVMSHRIIFEILEAEREIRVLSIYHMARDRFVFDEEAAPSDSSGT